MTVTFFSSGFLFLKSAFKILKFLLYGTRFQASYSHSKIINSYSLDVITLILVVNAFLQVSSTATSLKNNTFLEILESKKQVTTTKKTYTGNYF